MHVMRRTLTALGLGLLGAVLFAPANGYAVTPPTAPGYWLVGGDGGVFAFNAPFYGSGTPAASQSAACGFPPPLTFDYQLRFCTAISASMSGSGYWLLNVRDAPIPYGQAGPAPSQNGCTALNEPGYVVESDWSGVASSSTGAGYWLASKQGLAMGCGDVTPPSGGTTNLRFNAPVVGIAGTPGGKGYWLVSADGGIFAFGDALFAASMGSSPLNAPMVGMAPTSDGGGYWLVAADGGVFSFGDATFQGSMGGIPLNAPVVGIVASPSGQGYWLAAADGGVFSFGSAPFAGSMGGKALAGPITGIATYSGLSSG